jgi:hypothetical protein
LRRQFSARRHAASTRQSRACADTHALEHRSRASEVHEEARRARRVAQDSNVELAVRRRLADVLRIPPRIVPYAPDRPPPTPPGSTGLR